MRLIVKNITIKDFENVEKQIRDANIGISAGQEIRSSLNDFFVQASPQDDYQLRWTFFRIYTELTWKFFDTLDRDFIIENAFKRQAVMAIILGFDPLYSLMWYLGLHAVDNADMSNLYLKVKNVFLNSEEIVGKFENEDIKAKDLIQRYSLLNQVENDTIVEAEFMLKIKQTLFPKEMVSFFVIDPEVGINRFLELVEFFNEIDEEKIWFVVNAFLYPETDEKTQPTAQIKSQIDSQFTKDATGQYTDIEGVFSKLNELANKNNNPKIAELYYYDEQENKFKWAI